jgi:predicted transcriptional regulator
MTPPLEPQPRYRRYSIRLQARLDAETHAKLETLAKTFHRRHATILRCIMQWGVIHGKDWTVDRSLPASVHPTTMLVNPELVQQVQEAADAHGTSVAAWLRHAMRQVNPEHFPVVS